MAFVSSLFPDAPEGLPVLAMPLKVQGDCAISINIVGESRFNWTYIESSVPVKPALNEIAPEDPLAKAVWGLSVNDTFIHPGYASGKVVARLDKLENKFVHRANDLLESLPDLFPNQQFVKRFRAEGVEELSTFLEQDRQRMAPIVELYSAGRAPVHALARATGHGVTELWLRMTQSNGPLIPVWNGQNHELNNQALASKSEIGFALDSSAVGAIGGPIVKDFLGKVDLWATSFVVAKNSKMLADAKP